MCVNEYERLKRLDTLVMLETQALIKQVIARNIVYRPKYSDSHNLIKKAKIIQRQIDKLLVM